MTFAQPFANYEILARVGAGSMGTVFKARQKHLDRIVALKVLKPALARDARFVERLEREGRTVARLNHPNIVTAYDLGHEGGYHYLVMEFVEGKSLRQLLTEWGRFPEAQVLQLAREMAGALAHAHECGVTHRDIKPANILIDGDGRAKLTDLGLARAETDLALTRDGATVGTPQYISPEQARNPRDADIRSDLYSLGATLFHMLTGQPPFRADAIGELIDKVLHERPDSVVDLVAEVSDGLSLVIRKLLAKDPSLRYQSPTELLADLDRVERRELPEVDVEELEHDRVAGRTDVRSAPRRVRTLPWLRSIAFVLVGVVLGIVATLTWRNHEMAGTRLRLEKQLAGQRLARDRFEILDRAAGDALGTEVAIVAELRASVVGDLEREVLDELREIRGVEDRALVASLELDASTRDGGEFIRRIALPRLIERTGYRPETLPTAELRATAQRALALLRETVETKSLMLRNFALERLGRLVESELRPQCLSMARAGRPRSALDRFESEIRRRVEFEAARGETVSAVDLARVVDRPRAALRAEILAIQSELSAAALEWFAELRRRYEEEVGALERERPSARLLHDAVARVNWAILSSVPAREELLPDGATPWPPIDEWSVGDRQRVEGLSARWAENAAQSALHAAYAAWAAGSGATASAILAAVSGGADTTSPGLRRHGSMFLAWADLVDSAVTEVLGGKDEASVTLEFRDRAREVVFLRSDGEGIRCLDRVDRAPVSLATLPLEDLLRRAGVAVDQPGADHDGALLARALSMYWNGEETPAIEALEHAKPASELLQFFVTECVPRLASVRDAKVRERSDLQVAIAKIVEAQASSNVALVERLLAEVDARFDPAELSSSRAFLRDVSAWVKGVRSRARPLADLSARSPAVADVRLLDDGTEIVELRVGNLGAAVFQAGWQREDGVARHVPGDQIVRRGALRDPLISASFPSPFPPGSASVTVDVEFQLGAPSSELRTWFLELHGSLIAIAVLPSGAVAVAAAAAAPSASEHLRSTLAGSLLVSAASPHLVIGDVWHELRIVQTNRGGSVDLRVELDGQDRAPLFQATIQAPIIATPRIGFGSLSPLGLRRLLLSHRP
ncbi:MAG: protein kinase [Planctomycetota bacterium]